MPKQKMAAIILAAGRGTRMKSDLPKVMHMVAGKPMIKHVLDGVEELCPERIVVVVGDNMDSVSALVQPHASVVQNPPLGTAHAVRCAMECVKDFTGDILVLFADTPMISSATLKRMLHARRRGPQTAVVVLGFRPDDPGAYGRLITGDDGSLLRIVEAKDAAPDELSIGLCNSGVMAFDGQILSGLLVEIGNDNAKGEYYLTDIIEIARRRGLFCTVVEGDANELIGVNSRHDLSRAEAVAQRRLGEKARGRPRPPELEYLYDSRIGPPHDKTLWH